VEELGIIGLAAAMLVHLGWIIRKQANTIDNHLDSIQRTLDNLPCKSGAGCPEEDEP
jgi:hypothetical protein